VQGEAQEAARGLTRGGAKAFAARVSEVRGV
jgi:hypothetical protein